MLKYLTVALAALCVILGLTALQYRGMYEATEFALTTQNAAIKRQNLDATALEERLRQRAVAAETALNERAAAQEKTDEAGKARVAADDSAQRAAPVRVRYVTRACGPGGGSAPGEKAPAAQAGAGDTGTASGVLPSEGARRLADALTEIENMSLAYASCRERLLKE